MKTKFIKVCHSIHDYKKLTSNNKDEICFVVERVIHLKYEYYNFMTNHLDEPIPYINNHLDEMFIDENGVWHVLMIFCLRADSVIYFMQESEDSQRFVGFTFNQGEKVEFHSPHCIRKKIAFVDESNMDEMDLERLENTGILYRSVEKSVP